MIKRIKFFLLFLSFFGNVHLAISQVKNTKIKMAEGLLLEGKTYTALTVLEELHQEDPLNKHLLYQIVQTYTSLHHYAAATSWMQKLWDLNPQQEYPLVQFEFAQLLKTQQKYIEALNHFEDFTSSYKGSDKFVYAKLIKQEIAVCKSAMQLEPNPEWKVDYLSEINSISNDLAPFYWDNQLLFSSNRSDSVLSYEDLPNDLPKIQLYSQQANQIKLFLPKKIFDQETHQANIAFSLDSQRLYFNRCKENLKGKMICAIYGSKKEGKDWLPAKLISGDINDEKNEFTVLHPSLDYDVRRKMDVLYYVSDKPGGRGGLDIWKCMVNENFMSEKSQNLGPKVNTEFNEITPYFHPQSLELYFASNGHASYGGYDIYKLQDNGRGRLDQLEHLLPPTNSAYDDFYFHKVSTQKAFLVSNRLDSLAKPYYLNQVMDNIYEWTNMGKKYLQISFLDDSTLLPINDVIIWVKNKDKPMEDGLKLSAQNTFVAIPNYTYTFIGEHPEYINQSYTYTYQVDAQKDTVKHQFILKKLSRNTVLSFNHILFKLNSYELEKENEDIRAIYDLLISNPSFKILLIAHTDNQGTEVYNLELSQKRAESLKNYLVNKGIGASRITSIGKGSTQAIAENDTELGRAQNRRIEIQILSN